MKTYIFAFIVSAVLSFVLTPWIIRLAKRWGVLDTPSQIKVHATPIPRLGGAAVFFSFWLTLLVIATFRNQIGDYLRGYSPVIITLFWGSLGIFLLGVYDDIKGSGALLKLCAQVAVALFVCRMGFQIDKITNPFGSPIMLGWLSWPVTVFWIVGIINALNLVDGLDGLASGVVFIACLSLMGINLILGDTFLVLILMILSGALLGFLRYNFNPAQIFLGDSGSLFLGFILAVTSLLHDKKSPTIVMILIPILILGFPIMDTLASIARRLRKGVSPFKGDKLHTHHLLLDIGFSHRRSVAIIYGFCLLLGILAFVLSFQQNNRVALFLFIVGVVSVLFLRQVAEAVLHEKIDLFARFAKHMKAVRRARGIREIRLGREKR